jgi:hypothetical protein
MSSVEPGKQSRQPQTGPRQVRMADVAHSAGVSHQTVSRVINAPDTVRVETRQRVLAAIAELD